MDAPRFNDPGYECSLGLQVSQSALAPEPSPAVVELAGVTFRRGQREILHGIDLTVRRGEHWVMIGPNGAGKSTILTFCGALGFPTSGTVRVLGETLGHVELQALRRSIGHVNPRHPLRSALTMREVVLTGLSASVELPMRWQASDAELGKADELLALLGLDKKAESRWPTMSQGERGRALIARALISDPQLLLLDEPSTALDVAAREQLLETVDGLSASHPQLASVLVTHHLEELPETTSHALLIADGAVVAAGTTDAVLTSELVSRAFEHPIDVEHRDGRWSARTRRAAGAPR